MPGGRPDWRPPGVARVALPPKLIPVFQGEADVRGARGGRGSGKTRSFATMTAVRAYMWSRAGRSGIILGGRQYMNSLADSSMAEIKAAIEAEPWLKAHFEIGEQFIRTADKRIAYAFAGLDRNIGSIKSKAKILLCWVDEAEDVTEDAWATLIPTLREEDSELWVTWNPRRRNSATNLRFGQGAPPDPRYKIVELNWRDNPRFPDVLERQRLRDKELRPDTYDHIWEGAYATGIVGAYYAKALTVARAERRIGRLAEDPLLRLRAFVDIGGTGRNADAFAMWIAQFVGRECRVLDYYEAVGQPIQAHVAWLHERGYSPDRLDIWLPHDGGTHDRVYDVSYESELRAAGYTVEVVPNQGRGAAMARINAGRRMFPACWFDEERTSAGVDALGWYHEKRDEIRDVGLGPEHDWASHCGDAFGLLAIVYEDAMRQRGQVGAGAAKTAARRAWGGTRRGSSAMAA